jgi:hypothetical protein
MASPTIEALKKQVDDISAEYAGRFAGHSRVTRSLEELDGIIGRASDVVQRLDGLPKSAKDEEVTALLDTAKGNLELYRAERLEIQKAKAEGPELEEFSRLGTQANFVFARYRRHFAGKSRATRDLGMLAEMIDDLNKIQPRMKDIVGKTKIAGLKDDFELVTNNIKLYTAERGEIVDARGAGTPEEQADILAEVANGQFQLYTDHFANKARISRRPQLLQRMIDNLKLVKDRMQGLKKAGLKSEQNEKNIEIVSSNLQMYINELAEVRKARAAVKLVELMGTLGTAANDVMEDYRKDFAGKDRKTRDLDMLSVLCDQLGEIGRQMYDLGRAEPNESNTSNLAIVTDNLAMFEAEYANIETAKADTATK